MSNHRITYLGSGDTLQARCSCKKRSKIGNREAVDLWQFEHLHEVQRIRTLLHGRGGTLKTSAAWFAQQAENPDVDPDERALWQQLAEEAGAYLSRKSAMLEQDPLF